MAHRHEGDAGVAELVDARGLGPRPFGGRGSSPLVRTLSALAQRGRSRERAQTRGTLRLGPAQAPGGRRPPGTPCAIPTWSACTVSLTSRELSGRPGSARRTSGPHSKRAIAVGRLHRWVRHVRVAGGADPAVPSSQAEANSHTGAQARRTGSPLSRWARQGHPAPGIACGRPRDRSTREAVRRARSARRLGDWRARINRPGRRNASRTHKKVGAH